MTRPIKLPRRGRGRPSPSADAIYRANVASWCALSTVDWSIQHEGVEPDVKAIRNALAKWPGDDKKAAERKLERFDERVIAIALQCLAESKLNVSKPSA